MQTLEHSNQGAANPWFTDQARTYWLAYLLTGRREPSMEVAMEAVNFQEGASHFFSTRMPAWPRRVAIAKALAAIRDELAESANRTASNAFEEPALPPRNWALDGGTTKTDLERALLAIDAFPRCALVLSVFERVPLEDTASLLDAGPDVVRAAQTIGLQELTRNLAVARGWTSTAARSYVNPGEVQDV
jgi:DNA-directed RNA polymerase specialized sigma24 family protein